MVLPERLPGGKSNGEVNNTSGFYCRKDEQTPSQMSRHSYGLSIDINPIQNPAIVGGSISPKSGKKFLDRSLKDPAMIHEGDEVFTIFARHGWAWGGYFKQVDYHHFDKVITPYYRANQIEYLPPSERVSGKVREFLF